jgi:hypothetical protein
MSVAPPVAAKDVAAMGAAGQAAVKKGQARLEVIGAKSLP